MSNLSKYCNGHVPVAALSLMAWQFGGLTAEANPTGGTVAQGSATFNAAGPQFTINQTSANALINWQSFNIAQGETTTFNQPSSSSVAWNQINGGSPSQILGNLNANGYVILQNQSGFYVGGTAAVSAHGLILTTSPTPAPNLSGGGAWEFDAPPPSAQIVNYGRISLGAGGSAYLIASDIQNHGTISAPNGTIGLYAGEKVLLSPTPDGRGISTTVTLPEGSVDNEGRLVADAGTIIAQAKAVNNSGVVQANTVQNVNGTIELLASDKISLGASSVISARGDSSGVSDGGSVTIKSGNTLADQGGSTIDIQGGAQGGNGGQAEISARELGVVNSTVHGQASAGYSGGALLIDPTLITLDAPTETGYNSLITGGGLSQFTVSADNIIVNTSWATPAGLSLLNIAANDSITFNTVWNLVAAAQPSTLNLSATSGNIVFNPGSGIVAANNGVNNWNLNLSAGNNITLASGTMIQADAAKISLTATKVDLYGTLQANSKGLVNGVIDVNASDQLTLESTAVVDAHGDNASSDPSPGGFVVLQAGNNFSDTATSQIDASGHAGGQDGILEVFGGNLSDATSLNSQIGNTFATLVNPYDITLSDGSTDTSSSSPTLGIGDLAAYSHIDLHALDNIELSAYWNLNDPTASTPGAWAALDLTAGNNIIVDDGAAIAAGNNWNVNLTAGTALSGTPTSGNDGIYLNNTAFVQTQNGDINAWAANEIIVQAGGITTFGGGNINVYTQSGDVNAGSNPYGYDYSGDPYYSVDSQLGGISTGAGGNVTIHAGRNVYSFSSSDSSVSGVGANDAGSGAFGPGAAGNVTVTAGGSIYGHYVLADGTGLISAGHNVGALTGNPFALSLIDGSWTVNASPVNGNIYLQEVRNPNGVFNNADSSSSGYHLFDYGLQDSVSLNAYGVVLTGRSTPRPAGNVLVLYPSILDISAGAGGVDLENNVTLFPSPFQSLVISTTDGGSLIGQSTSGNPVQLLMSDSGKSKWTGSASFGTSDESATPMDLNDPNPVTLDISGNVERLNLIVSEAATINVGGSMINCAFSGENLHGSDVTSITVAGQIYNQSAYAFVPVPSITGVPADALPAGFTTSWDDIFSLALDPTKILNLVVPADLTTPNQVFNYAINNAHLFPIKYVNGVVQGQNPGFVYDSKTGQLGFGGPISPTVSSELTQPITVLKIVNGAPVVDSTGHYVTETFTWVTPSIISTLATASLVDPSPNSVQQGYRLGGPGTFDITANSISLGNSQGILSAGVSDPSGGFGRYNNLASVTPQGASVDVTVNSDQTDTETVDGTVIAPHASLTMLTSTIAAVGGGEVNVNSLHGSMDLGSEALANSSRQVGFGVFTSGLNDVNVTAEGDINIDGSRIATYNGGNILVESFAGNIDVGSGGDTATGVYLSYVMNGVGNHYAEDVYGSGIVANTLVKGTAAQGYPQTGASIPVAKAPGNIVVKTPQGNITASLGGITQESPGGKTPSGPTITLEAGTPGGHTGNIDLGQSGVIGGSVNVIANGNIKGLIISRQNSQVQAAQNFSGSVLAGGSASVTGGGTVSGTIIGVGGVNVSGGSVTADVLGQNVSINGGASQSTLGSSAAATTTSQAAAQQASNENKQEVASTNNDDDEKKKKHPLTQHVKRVTVILPSKT
jgi:filamentous hemagglutinin family protein